MTVIYFLLHVAYIVSLIIPIGRFPSGFLRTTSQDAAQTRRLHVDKQTEFMGSEEGSSSEMEIRSLEHGDKQI